MIEILLIIISNKVKILHPSQIIFLLSLFFDLKNIRKNYPIIKVRL